MLVVLSKKAKHDILLLPIYIQEKLYLWVMIVSEFGIEKARKSKGFNDEALKGKRKGQRSIRLNRSYRAIYIENQDGLFTFIEVVEVNKHEY